MLGKGRRASMHRRLPNGLHAGREFIECLWDCGAS